MQIFVRVKSVGKRRPVLDHRELVLSRDPDTLKDLIAGIVENEVQRFNARGEEQPLVPYLTRNQMEDQMENGKVGVGWKYSDKKADVEQAVENALQCFEDGIYKVFINEQEQTRLSDPVRLQDGDVLTFIRLAMLSGRLW